MAGVQKKKKKKSATREVAQALFKRGRVGKKQDCPERSDGAERRANKGR